MVVQHLCTEHMQHMRFEERANVLYIPFSGVAPMLAAGWKGDRKWSHARKHWACYQPFLAAGTCSLYLGTFGFEMPGLFTISHDAVMQASARNKRRLILQRFGLILILLCWLE
jgi:hypothetical protein